MSNKTVTQLQYESVVHEFGSDQPEIFRFAGEDTWEEGTLMARRLRSIADGVITGTGTREATMTARENRTALVGTYNLTAGTLSSGVGEWTMTDPYGRTETYTTTAAGEDMTFPDLGVNVDIADIGDDFETSDEIDFAVTENTDVVPMATDGSNGEDQFVGVLTHELSRDSAGVESGHLMVEGKVRFHRLVLHADGDNSNITKEIRDQMAKVGVLAVETEVLSQQES